MNGVFLAGAMWLFASSAEATPLTLEGAEEAAREHARRTQFDAILARREAELAQASLPGDPEIRWGLDNGDVLRDPLRSDPPRWELQLRMPFERLGAVRLGREAAQHRLTATEYEVQVASDRAAREARVAWLTVWGHQEVLTLAVKEEGLARDWVSVHEQAWLELGGSIDDLASAERAVLRAEKARAESALTLADAERALVEITGIYDATVGAEPGAMPEVAAPCDGSLVVATLEAEVAATQADLVASKLASVPWPRFGQVGVDINPAWPGANASTSDPREVTWEARLAFEIPVRSWAGREVGAFKASLRSLSAQLDAAEGSWQRAGERRAATYDVARTHWTHLDELAQSATRRLGDPPYAPASLGYRVHAARLEREAAEALVQAWQLAGPVACGL